MRVMRVRGRRVGTVRGVRGRAGLVGLVAADYFSHVWVFGSLRHVIWRQVPFDYGVSQLSDGCQQMWFVCVRVCVEAELCPQIKR